MKRIEFAIISGLIISVILSSFTAFSANCDSVRKNTLRLHILANSDSKEDQDLKLSVRDKILEHSPELFDSAQNLNDALQNAEEKLPQIKEIVDKEIKKRGYSYKTKVYLCDMYFETREYDGITMPAGRYKALRIEIGKAKGHNWWCVLFPTLCIPSAQGSDTIENVFSQEEISTISKPKYEAKFAILEFFEKMKNRA